jgi:hypothetical protein
MAKISTRNITAENVEDVMTTAAYGGITYWAQSSPTPADFENVPLRRGRPHGPSRGTGRRGNVFHLTPAQDPAGHRRGGRGQARQQAPITATTCSRAFRRLERPGTASTAARSTPMPPTCIVQVACFGEVVYG